jgi:hypothetical protein
MNEKKQDKDFQEEFDQLDTEIYKSFVEAGWVIPQSEEEVVIAEKALRKIQIPPVPAGVKDSSPLIARLRKERDEREKNVRSVFKGILARATDLGMTNFQLAEKARLSVALVTKLDLGLIPNYKRIPATVIEEVAGAIKTTVQELYDHWNRGPRFAAGVEFKSADTPEIEGQDFFEAVRQDSSLSEERRAELLALEEKL